MERQKRNLVFFSLLNFFLLSVLSGNQCVLGSSHHHGHHHHGHHRGRNGFNPTKLFVFGDSYADTGNTNKSTSNSWKYPYGITFPGKPSGRFSDGRILSDRLANFLKLKSPIAYELRKYAPNRLHYGMNFAFGGTGVFGTLVAYPNMTIQIDFFDSLIKKSVYHTSDLHSSLALVTCSGNDYTAYLAKNGTSQGFPTFITLVVNQLALNLKRIHDAGVKKVVVAGLEPSGCLPAATFSNSYQGCNATVNTVATLHNQLLEQAVAKLNAESTDSPFVILDLFGSFTSVLENKGKVPFETPILKPCCVGICGEVDKNGTKLYTLCANPRATFFWDLVHPTQSGWRAIFSALKSTLEKI